MQARNDGSIGVGSALRFARTWFKSSRAGMSGGETWTHYECSFQTADQGQLLPKKSFQLGQ
jgi:hypothetical protein